MRPAGELRVAILGAARSLASSSPQGRGPSLQEMAEAAGVGYSAAMDTVKNLKRAGALCITHRRKVSYRNKPVAEYRPADLVEEQPEKQESMSVDESIAAIANAWK